MLITFKSKAYPNVLMYQEHAKRILDLLNKDADRGVITAAEAPQAVSLVESEIEESRNHHSTDEMERDVMAHHGAVDNSEHEHEQISVVSFPTRAYPLLEMLRAARDQHADVLWGV